MSKICSFLKTIVIILFIAVICGCPMNGNQPDKTTAGLNAVSVPEGIKINFDYIPHNTSRVYVFLHHLGGKEAPESSYDFTGAYTNITGSSLNKLKKTRSVIYPFVRTDLKYEIIVFLEKEGDVIDNDYKPEYISAECIADKNGIYINNDVEFVLNDALTVASLTTEPAFSSPVEFSPVKYMYNLTISFTLPNGIKADAGLGRNETPDALFWDFEHHIKNDIKYLSDYLKDSSYHAYVTAHSSIIYDNNTWVVEIAKTPVFSVNS